MDPKSPTWIPGHGPVLMDDLEPDLNFFFGFGIHMPGERRPTDRAVMVIALERVNASRAYFLCMLLPRNAQRRRCVRLCETDAAREHHSHLSP